MAEPGRNTGMMLTNKVIKVNWQFPGATYICFTNASHLLSLAAPSTVVPL